MNETTKETIEITAGELYLNVPYTSEGLKVVRAMITLLEAGLPPIPPRPEEKIKSDGGAPPNLEVDSEKNLKTSEDKTTSPFSPPISSPKQRIKFKDWEAIAMTKAGILYKEVVDRFLEEYKDSAEPVTEKLFQIIREMYGEHLKKNTIATYVSQYKRYIRENKLAEAHFTKEEYKEDAKNLRVIPIEKVVEIWNLLPGEFTYKQVKALIPVSIMQSDARVDATNYAIREFKVNPTFECEETSPGVFLKKEGEN